jgi:hypothetical protein
MCRLASAPRAKIKSCFLHGYLHRNIADMTMPPAPTAAARLPERRFLPALTWAPCMGSARHCTEQLTGPRSDRRRPGSPSGSRQTCQLPSCHGVTAVVHSPENKCPLVDRSGGSADQSPQGRSANRSLSAIEPVSAPSKWKLKNGDQRPAPKTRPARTEMSSPRTS